MQQPEEQFRSGNSENLKGAVKNLPTREVIDVPVDEMLIVELYSSNNQAV